MSRESSPIQAVGLVLSPALKDETTTLARVMDFCQAKAVEILGTLLVSG